MPAINLMDRYPRSKRPIEERGNSITEEHREIARRFDENFFDGDRLYGYGGYNYHPRFWQETVKRFAEHYQLAPDASILDVGCGKGFMMHDFRELMPQANLAGIDISEYAISNGMDSVKDEMQVACAMNLPYPDKSFDLVISINSIHNLDRAGCMQALREIQRVSRKHAFITVDAWRNEQEKTSLLKWILTAKTFMHADDWVKLFAEAGYTGDYYWFIAE
jgi:ubiquinone/menaquinone biosynthesis C-methylase UbiE